VGLGFRISVLPVSLDRERGVGGKTHLRLGVFRAVWARVVQAGRFRLHDWTAKVDPDTVFFPDRLRAALQHRGHAADEPAAYLKSCKLGVRGPVKVLSRAAVRLLDSGWGRCEKHFNWRCSGPCWWSEDRFVDQCLSKVLEVRRDFAGAAPSGQRCEALESGGSCQDPSQVAFYPFETAESYRRCLTSARSAERAVYFQ